MEANWKHYTPSNVTEVDKERIFSKMPSAFRYCVVFDEVMEDKGASKEKLFGNPIIKPYVGEAVCQWLNFYETFKEAEEDCKVIPRLENGTFKNAFIVKR